MRQIAGTFAAEDQAMKDAFYSLLYEGGAISVWAAHHILEIVGGPPCIQRLALAQIEEAARTNDAQAMGERMWLADYEKKTTEPCAPPNGGPAAPLADSGVADGPPSVI